MKEIMFGKKKAEAARKDGVNTKNKRAGSKTAAVAAFTVILPLVSAGCGLSDKIQQWKGGEQDKTEQTDNGVSELEEKAKSSYYAIAEELEKLREDSEIRSRPVITIWKGQVMIDLSAKKDEEADTTFVNFVNKKKEEPAEGEELSGKDQLKELGCEVREEELDDSGFGEETVAKKVVPVAVCVRINGPEIMDEETDESTGEKEKSIEKVCDAACEERTDKQKKEKDQLTCIKHCKSGAMTRLINSEDLKAAELTYNFLTANGINCERGFAVVKVLAPQEVTDVDGHIIKTYDESSAEILETAVITVYAEECKGKGGGTKQEDLKMGSATSGGSGASQVDQ